MQNYHELLGVPNGADKAVIDKAYQAKLSALINKDLPEAVSDPQFKALREAWVILGDKALERAYKTAASENRVEKMIETPQVKQALRAAPPAPTTRKALDLFSESLRKDFQSASYGQTGGSVTMPTVSGSVSGTTFYVIGAVALNIIAMMIGYFSWGRDLVNGGYALKFVYIGPTFVGAWIGIAFHRSISGK